MFGEFFNGQARMLTIWRYLGICGCVQYMYTFSLLYQCSDECVAVLFCYSVGIFYQCHGVASVRVYAQSRCIMEVCSISVPSMLGTGRHGKRQVTDHAFFF